MAEEKRDYYEVLGVGKDATPDQLKAAYLSLAKKYHPDLNKSPDAPKKFQEVQEAYDILKDPDKRKAYDQFGFAGVDPSAAGQQGFDASGFDGMDMGDIFSQIFGQGVRGGGRSRKQTGPVQGNDQVVKIRISFADSISGTKVEMPVSYDDVCDRCGGNGAEPGSGMETCPYCHGTGTIRTQSRTIFGIMEQQSTCPHCNGSGKIISDKCHKCGGSGYVHVNSKIDVNVPAGIADGEQIRIAGKGAHGYNGGPSGDLYIIVNVQGDQTFKRDRNDIHVTIPVSVLDLILGTTITVPTVYGSSEVSIKPSTATDAVLRLRSQGVKSRRGYEDAGDEYIHLDVKMPSALTPEQKTALENVRNIEETKKPDKTSFHWKDIFHKK
jgi:molecular chaperone DnaJ